MHRVLVFGTIAALLLGRVATAAAQPATEAPSFLVSTQWLQEHLDDSHVRVIFTGARDVYDRAHIPGARLLDHMATLGSGYTLLPPATLAGLLAEAGAGDGAHVILYGDDPMASGWLFVAFASIGHALDASLLDGGIDLWRAEGRPLSSTAPPAGKDRLTVQPAPDVTVDARWVRSHLELPDVRVLDVRTSKEWDAGHLPDATLVLWQDLFTDQRTLKFKSLDQFRALFTRAGVQQGQQVVTYCAVGMRASLMYWAAQAAGLPARVYVGSFNDWRQDSTNPIVK
jgi:thiosulfate/3-mercaptopyruvate sulfurtransferase